MEIILNKGSANKRRRYNATSSLISWTHTQNDPCFKQSLSYFFFSSFPVLRTKYNKFHEICPPFSIVLWFLVVLHSLISPYPSGLLEQSYVWLSVSEATLNNTDKYVTWLKWPLMIKPQKTGEGMFYGIYGVLYETLSNGPRYTNYTPTNVI